MPIDSSIVTTAGRPVGIAEIARLMPTRKRSIEVLAADEAEHDDEDQRGGGHDRDDDGELVELLGERRLLLLDAAQHPGDVTDLARHAGRGDDHLAATSGDLRVHVRHVDAVAERHVVADRPGPMLFETGVLSPVSPASSISSVAATRTRPSAGTLSPASNPTMSPGTSSSAGISTIWPSRFTLAVMISICRSAATLSAALPSWCSPITAFRTVSPNTTRAVDTSCSATMLTTRGADEHQLHQVLVLAEERLPTRLLRFLGELVRPVLAPVAW